MVDWQAIEAGYRAGECSVRELARRENVSEGAIRKRAVRIPRARMRTGPYQRPVRTLVRSFESNARARWRGRYALQSR